MYLFQVVLELQLVHVFNASSIKLLRYVCLLCWGTLKALKAGMGFHWHECQNVEKKRLTR